MYFCSCSYPILTSISISMSMSSSSSGSDFGSSSRSRSRFIHLSIFLRVCTRIVMRKCSLSRRSDSRRVRSHTANLHTNIMDFGGFDSSIVLILRGGILMSIGDFEEDLSQAMLVGIMLVGRLGVSAPGLGHQEPPGGHRRKTIGVPLA